MVYRWLAFILCGCLITSASNADMVLGWDFSSGSSASPLPATFLHSGFASTGLQRGTGVTVQSIAGGWGGQNYQGTDLSNAISINDFFTFGLTVGPSAILSISQLDAYNVRRSSTARRPVNGNTRSIPADG